MIEFLNDSNIKAKTSKIFEAQIFNEALELTFPDIEYICNSTNAEVQKIRTKLFGTFTPTTYFIEYAEVTQSMLDDFTEQGLTFTECNFGVKNYQTYRITEEVSELSANVMLSDNGYSLTSTLSHTAYDIEAFIRNAYQINDEAFDISHIVVVTEYNAIDEVIATSNIILSNPTNTYAPVKIRPLLSEFTNHAMVEVLVKISNSATGLTISKSASILIKDIEVDKFKAKETFALSFEKLEVKNIVEKKVNQIVQEATTPKILTITKNVYVQTMEGRPIELASADMYVELFYEEGTNETRTYLKIGDLSIQNEPGRNLTFKIPSSIYYSNVDKYVLMNKDYEVMQVGGIIRL
jgi:hypothetical protein